MAEGMSEGGYQQINKTLNADAFEEYLSAQQAHLPALHNLQRLSERVSRVLGFNPGKFTLQGTNTYIVGTGPSRLLIDTGQGILLWAQTLSEYLAAEKISIDRVLLTHWHGDHTGGVPDLIRLYPHLAGAIYKNAPGTGQLAINDGQEFRVQGATVVALHAPGHSHDHTCFVIKEDNAMFTGDNILGHGSSAHEDLGQYMDTLTLMQQRNCTLGYPAHGAVLTDLKAKIALELGQKRRRERQLVKKMEALKTEAVERSIGNGNGSASVEELVIAVHGGAVSEHLRKQILEPFTDEILRKIVGEGRVGFEISGGERKWFVLGIQSWPPSRGGRCS